MKFSIESTNSLKPSELVSISGGELPMSPAQASEYGKSLNAGIQSICEFCSDFASGFVKGYNSSRN